jgi:N-acetylneuraminate synthase/N,N'-diacetyllegionaminate synthase
VASKRPGTGISPMNWDQIVGKKSKRNYLVDDLITDES